MVKSIGFLSILPSDKASTPLQNHYTEFGHFSSTGRIRAFTPLHRRSRFQCSNVLRRHHAARPFNFSW